MPLIRAVCAQADAWRAAEVARAQRPLARGEPVDAVLDALARGLTAKLMHGALTELRSADGERREQLALAVQRLFLHGAARSGSAH